MVVLGAPPVEVKLKRRIRSVEPAAAHFSHIFLQHTLDWFQRQNADASGGATLRAGLCFKANTGAAACTCVSVVCQILEDVFRGEVGEGKITEFVVSLGVAGDDIDGRLDLSSTESAGNAAPMSGGMIWQGKG